MLEFIKLIGLTIRVVAEIIGLYVIFNWMIKKIKKEKDLLEKEKLKSKLIKEIKLKYEHGKISEEELKNELSNLETL